MIKKYPKLRFIVSKRQELNTYLAFLEQSKYSDNERDMNWAFYKPHPKLKVLKQKNQLLLNKKTVINKYVAGYYKKNFIRIKKGNIKAKKNWGKIEKIFFKLTSEIFKGHKWPKGKYIAYPTIWGLYPRFLEDKTFQFPFFHKRKNFTPIVIAHEMLHFIFYDYVYKAMPKLKNHKYDFDLWAVSEIFNIIIQNSPEWSDLFKEKAMPYPEHKDLTKKLEIVWAKSNGNIKNFVKKSLQIISK